MMSPVVRWRRMRSAIRRALRMDEAIHRGRHFDNLFQEWEAAFLEAERKGKITPQIQARHDFVADLKRRLSLDADSRTSPLQGSR